MECWDHTCTFLCICVSSYLIYSFCVVRYPPGGIPAPHSSGISRRDLIAALHSPPASFPSNSVEARARALLDHYSPLGDVEGEVAVGTGLVRLSYTRVVTRLVCVLLLVGANPWRFFFCVYFCWVLPCRVFSLLIKRFILIKIFPWQHSFKPLLAFLIS